VDSVAGRASGAPDHIQDVGLAFFEHRHMVVVENLNDRRLSGSDSAKLSIEREVFFLPQAEELRNIGNVENGHVFFGVV
jgi:hypothetical protein